jgi:hypothetical protein
MGSTNKTQYLQLPQWIGTDQPTFLGDMNDAFLKIDNGYNDVNGDASSAISQAGQAVQTANNANTAATTAQETAESASGDAKTALTTANNALEVANTANSSIASISSKVDAVVNQIAGITKWESGNIAPALASGIYTANFYNYNDSLKLLNIVMDWSTTTNANISNTVIGTLPASVRPSAERTIYSGCYFYTSERTSSYANISINETGQIKCQISTSLAKVTTFTVQLMLNVSDWGI